MSLERLAEVLAETTGFDTASVGRGGLVAALAVGVLDHYFFNIEFSHMTALLWCTVGLKLAIARSIDHTQDEVIQ